ncbi:MAG TPA: hypothetical protein VFQ22_13720 [Longimicrobiales bacterium]|nr:hypothetical protein [Longimicrobiales bacterium]
MRIHRVAVAALAVLALPAPGQLGAQENPLARLQPRGLGVSPVFEGWYRNPDGTYTLSFGYINRNTEQVLDIPVGATNRVEPGLADQGQPTHFTPRRSYGVFTVTVPADFGRDRRVTWTLEANGERYSIPGGLLDAYETDNLHARATDRYPPVVVLEPGSAESRGPNGARVGPVPAVVGRPLALRARAWDVQGRDVTLRWYAYRAPGAVRFDRAELPLGEGATLATTTATFSAPGDYVLYLRADHSDVRVSAAGLEQCCWTNAYLLVEVAP